MGKIIGGTTIVQRVQSNGEITVNINLCIKLENGEISISEEDNSIKKKEKSEYIVPDIELLGTLDFGDKVN